IAAALDYESGIDEEQLVLVADIGGGTSDFSVVRVGPSRHALIDRQRDILANHGIHVAGTDFDHSVNLAAVMPELGFGSTGPGGRRVPGKVYFDLATWHLINTVYAHNRVIELREMASMYSDATRYRRLMTVVTKKLGHHLAALAEQAKIDVAMQGRADIVMAAVEESLSVAFSEKQQAEALDHKVGRIVHTAAETVTQAGVRMDDISAAYFTGGSTGLGFLTERIAALFPNARRVTGDRFSSVASGLAIYAQRRFAG
ncbi:MAG: heat-shock protein, partial [Betaproteobacteria bacterium]|nr:heat-shock protein [Betaproteobacteria bacterium]